MRILCPICGEISEAVQVSPDYDKSRHCDFVGRARWVDFLYESKAVNRFLLSPEFRDAHGIEYENIPLPDDYPEWLKLLKVECRRCFEDRGANRGNQRR